MQNSELAFLSHPSGLGLRDNVCDLSFSWLENSVVDLIGLIGCNCVFVASAYDYPSHIFLNFFQALLLLIFIVNHVIYSMSDAFAGTLAVCASFPLIFLRCFACSDNSTLGHLSYYAPFITIFQIGWAATQISHMALMSQLTQDRSQQTELSGLRSVRSALIMLLLSVIIVEIPRWGTTFKFRPSTWFCSLAL